MIKKEINDAITTVLDRWDLTCVNEQVLRKELAKDITKGVEKLFGIHNIARQREQLKAFLTSVAEWKHDYSSTTHKLIAKDLLKKLYLTSNKE